MGNDNLLYNEINKLDSLDYMLFFNTDNEAIRKLRIKYTARFYI